MIPRFGDARDWFFERRLGLFLHFGLYALEGWHEQDQMRRFLPRAEYGRLIERFNPVDFDADALLDLAVSVGMGYICLTTKHHDGFCLWNTAHTDFNVMNSPCGRDLVAELADACRRREFPLGLYYSVADWRHPNYPNRGRHHELPGPETGDEPDWDAYMAFLKAQVRELCENYGPVHHFFWDMNVPKHRDPSVNAMMRSLQPAMVINDRGFDEGDFGTPEREYRSGEIDRLVRFDRPTEACNSVGSQSWGYRRDEDYYSARHLIQSVAATLARGGNYLLNIGPDAEGRPPGKAVALLRAVGAWYLKTREAYEGAEPATELTANREVLLTRAGQTLYVHLTSPPRTEAVVLSPFDRAPARATLLNSGEPVETEVALLPVHWKSRRPCLRVKRLPVDEWPRETMVVRLDFDAPLEACRSEEAAEFLG